MTAIHLPDRGPHGALEPLPGLAVVPLRVPTLPPATHCNCVVLGDEQVIVVDPASPYADEQARLARWLEGRDVVAIWLTHHHADHVSGAAALRRATGAPICAHPATTEALGVSLPVDQPLFDGDAVPLGEHTWEVLHTPGHTRGHVALRDLERRVVVAGDLVAGQGSVVIDPPQGNLADYLGSLGRLMAEGLSAIVPAHGPVLPDGEGKLLADIAHRMEREQQVLAGLVGGPARSIDLVPAIYPQVPPVFHALAARQVLAHLLKLEAEGRVQRGDGSTGVPGEPVYGNWGSAAAFEEPEFLLV